MPDIREQLCVRHLGRADYLSTWRAMQAFTLERGPDTPDELWLLEHPPVFTLGLNGKPEHLLDPGAIPVIPIDRGGQVTYHGPGQLVAYLLADLERRPLGVQALVRTLEQAVIDLLAEQGVTASARREAPGVYVDGAKVAALGLRVKKGRCYHGLALNVAMDLEPFARINPCGHPGQAVTQLRDLGISAPIEQVSARLQAHLQALLGYTGRPEETVAPVAQPTLHD
jgi:lipoyl(octanoyl) transferase